MTTLTPIILQPDTLLALHAAHPERYPVLLQSAAQGEPLGRFDILLACPGKQLTLHADGTLRSDANLKTQSGFLRAIDEWWQRERRTTVDAPVPFVGGWFLYLGYELAGEVEPSLNLIGRHVIARAIRIPAAVIVRHSDGAAWIVEEEGDDESTPRILGDLQQLAPLSPSTPCVVVGDLNEEVDRRYLDDVGKTLEHIAAGDIYQANLSRRWQGTLARNVPPYEIYARLRRSNPAPFAALAVVDGFAIASSSPERLIEIRYGQVSTRPIAGTRPRRADRIDDDARRHELQSHPKERAEHVMLIDLERNDLGRICEAGTVEVDEFMTLESYAHVHHIVSNVRGKLRSDVTPGEAIAAVFPGGTITGCPKVRCMQIISELEQAERGAYTGSLGYLNLDGSMDLNILIRTIEMRGNDIYFRAGAGIVADSIPERELDETRAKARGLIPRIGKLMLAALLNGTLVTSPRSAVNIEERGLSYGDGVFETMRLRKGSVCFLDDHLARLRLGCERLQIPAPTGDVVAADIAKLREQSNDGVLKLIVTRGAGGRGYRASSALAATRLAILYPSTDSDSVGIVVRWCVTRLARNPHLAGIKHLNRLEQVLAQNEWHDSGIAEGLMMDTEDEVVCGTATNLFVVCGGVLTTPNLRFSGVRGVMREQVLKTAARLGIESREGSLRSCDVLSADEVFVTNAVRGIRPVIGLEQQRWMRGPMTVRLLNALEQKT